MSPKTMACDGQLCAHAGETSPSRTGRSSSRARSLPSCIRWTQNEHFSMTPSLRAVTSGLSCRLSGASNSGMNQLNRRTL